MIFFLNLDGTMTRQDTGRIFQGSTAVPDIKVLSAVSGASGGLSVAFTLPSGISTTYFPLAVLGEYTDDKGFKTYLWGFETDIDATKDILHNITQEVGEVGVSVAQTTGGAVVNSYTASFTVEFSVLQEPPVDATLNDLQTILALLEAYYAQNRALINSILPEVNGKLDDFDNRLTEAEEELQDIAERVVLVNITTDLETGIGTKYYSDGTTATFQIATDVTVVNRNDFLTEVSFATTSNWQTDTDGTYFIAFSPQTLDRTNNKCMAVIDKLDGNGVFQTGNGVFKGSDGTIILRGVTTPFDGKLLVLGGGSAGTKIWTGTTENGYESIDGALNGDYYLDTVSGNLYLLNNGIWTFLFSMRAEFPQRDANTNGSVYVLTPNGFETPEFEQLTVETTDNVTFYIKVGGKTAGTITVPREIYLDDVTYNPETKTLSFIYNTESGEATIDIPLTDLEEVNNLLIVTTQSDFNDAVTSVNVGKVISYNSALYIVESVTENGTTTYRAKPYISLDEVTLFSTWQSSIENLATEDGDGITWTETSARVYAKNGVISQPFRYEMRIPLLAGAGIEFEMSEDGQFVTIKSTSSGGGITDVQVNGTSVVADGVANIPEASAGQAGVVTTGAQTFEGVKTFNKSPYFKGGLAVFQSGSTISGSIYFKSNSIYLGGNASRFTVGDPSSSPYGQLGQSQLKFAHSGTSTPNVKLLIYRPYYSKTHELSFPNETGTLMCAPSTWSTGTSGSAKLPEAGLYEIKFNKLVVGTSQQHHLIVYWDGGTNIAYSTIALWDYDTTDKKVVYAKITTDGVINIYSDSVANNTPTSHTIGVSYRKIGIA